MQIAGSRWGEARSARVVALIGALSCMGVAAVSYRYLVDEGLAPPIIALNTFRQNWLVLHAVSAATALLIAPMQFSSRIRRSLPLAHRWTGRVYVFSCLLGGISGFILAIGASTGPISSVGFGLLAIAWIVSTSLAWRAAADRRFVDHRAWMIRSFSLTFAAVTLRLYLPLLGILPISFTAGYQLISFAAWIPNLVVAEIILRRERRASGASPDMVSPGYSSKA